eukprot:scaffold105305_cov23-Tisochrysis_lutea.AAC.1
MAQIETCTEIGRDEGRKKEQGWQKTSADTVVPLLGVMNVVGRREATAMKTCAGLTLRPWSMLRPRRKCSPSWHSGFQGEALWTRLLDY